MTKQEKLDLHFMSLALITSYNLGKDPASKAGCVIVSPDGRSLCTGYNGFPPGVEETPERWARPKKYEFVLHSETNALLNASFNTEGCAAYVSWQPCTNCLAQLVGARIKHLVYYGFHPRYPDGNWPQTNQETWSIIAEQLTIAVIPKNNFLESLRALYPKLEP